MKRLRDKKFKIGDIIRATCGCEGRVIGRFPRHKGFCSNYRTIKTKKECGGSEVGSEMAAEPWSELVQRAAKKKTKKIVSKKTAKKGKKTRGHQRTGK